ncbi:hypothetical protein FHT92_004492 [Rhizobium sp. BK377]|nr:hypothetical protein [Rhizobium sp. BK377]
MCKFLFGRAGKRAFAPDDLSTANRNFRGFTALRSSLTTEM